MNQPSLIQHVSRLDTPDLQPYRTLRRPHEHIKEGKFIAEGEKVVRRLLNSTIPVISMLLTPEWLTKLQMDDSFSSRSMGGIFVAEKPLLESIVGFNLHQGIMAEGLMPEELPLRDLITSREAPRLFVALDGLVNSENVGMVVRNCAAFGVDGILIGETSSSPYLRRAVRNSMGTVFKLPVHHCKSLVETLGQLDREFGFTTIAAEPKESASLYTALLEGDICLVLGNEGAGISDTVLRACRNRIAIPMVHGIDSLNVASASAVCLYEVRRQRHGPATR